MSQLTNDRFLNCKNFRKKWITNNLLDCVLLLIGALVSISLHSRRRYRYLYFFDSIRFAQLNLLLSIFIFRFVRLEFEYIDKLKLPWCVNVLNQHKAILFIYLNRSQWPFKKRSIFLLLDKIGLTNSGICYLLFDESLRFYVIPCTKQDSFIS